jgi:hypothetical protein
MYSSKVAAYPSETLLANMTLDWKGLPWTNTLAYFGPFVSRDGEKKFCEYVPSDLDGFFRHILKKSILIYNV